MREQEANVLAGEFLVNSAPSVDLAFVSGLFFRVQVTVIQHVN
jgi:hypothetical protein